MTTATPDRSRFLRGSLRANAAFSALSGTLFTLAGGRIAGFLGIDPPLLVTVVGLNLLGFAATILYTASRPEPSRALALVIVGLDLAWVVGTIALVSADAFTRGGAAAAILIANVVLAFAVLQSIGVRRLGAAGATA